MAHGAGDMLNSLTTVVPELNEFANLHLKVAFNKDSSRVGPKEWVELARLLHNNRKQYDAFLVVHGTDTMAYTASALSLMLLGFKKPIVLTGDHCCQSSCNDNLNLKLHGILTTLLVPKVLPRRHDIAIGDAWHKQHGHASALLLVHLIRPRSSQLDMHGS